MNKKEEHDLLIRLDERTRNIWRVTEKIEKHQAEQNGTLAEALKMIEKNTTFRKWSIRTAIWAGSGIVACLLSWLGINIWW